MKNYIKHFALFLLTIITLSCSKDEVVYPEENPLSAYITNSGFVNSNPYSNSFFYSEFGLVFSPNVNGKIKALTAQLPDVNTNLRVTIWDYDSKVVLKTEYLNVSAANTVVTKSISELALQKDKKYLISMNSNAWYGRNKADNSNANYPVTAGNIKIHEYLSEVGTSQTFPLDVTSNYYAGDLSFVFQQIN